MDCQSCRNNILREVLLTRRSSYRILTAVNKKEYEHIIAAILNINHGLNCIDSHLEKCRKEEQA